MSDEVAKTIMSPTQAQLDEASEAFDRDWGRSMPRLTPWSSALRAHAGRSLKTGSAAPG